MKILLVTIWVLLLFVACYQKRQKENNTLGWNKIIIISEERTIIRLDNSDDTSTVNIIHSGSIFAPLPKGTKVKVDTLKVYFSMVEKDSIFNIVNDLIKHPPDSQMRCTDFVGDLELVIDYGAFKQEVEYSGICNWNSLSPQTMHLHDLLKKKLKGFYLGENKTGIDR